MKKYLLLSAAFVVMSSNVWAEEPISCGTGCLLYADGHAVVTGTGTLTGGLNMNGVKSLTIEGFSDIGVNALRSTGLESVVISESVTSIGDGAFWGAGNLTDVTIKGDVSLGNAVFWNTKVKNPDYKSVTYSCGDNCTATLSGDGSAVFEGRGALTSGSVPTGFAGYSSVYIDGFSSVTGFANRTDLKEVILSDSVTSIGDGAFSQSGIQSIVIPEGVTSIGVNAFRSSSIQSIVLPESVTSIGDGAFWGAGNLTSIVIPESVTSIGDCAFCNTKLTTMYCSISSQDICKNVAKTNGKSVNIVGSYKKKGKYILYYDYTGKLVNRGPNPSYKPKKIYTVEEAMEATKEGDSFHVFLTYK